MSTTKISEPFVPKTDIEKFVHAGDHDGLADYLADLTEAQRFAERAGVRKLYKIMHEIALWTKPAAAAWRRTPTEQQKKALHIAVYVCGTPQDMVEDWFAFRHRRLALVALWQRIPRNDIQEYADLAVARSANMFPVLHALFRAGMIKRPTHDNYVLGLLTIMVDEPEPRVPDPNLPATVAFIRDMDKPLWIRGIIDDDPEFAHTTLLRFFEIEGNSDISLANNDKYGKGLGSPRNTMHGLFLGLVEQGVYTRAVLLDKTLSALERDWLQFRSGWFSRFHETLAPTVDELSLHRDRYLSLCHSRIPPTVTLALGALQELVKREPIPAQDVLVALTPVMTSKVKAQIVVALKLLDAVVTAELAAKDVTALLAANALICDASDVQKQVIQRLQRWGVNEATRDMLRQFLPIVAATHRDAVQALIADDAASIRMDEVENVAANSVNLPELRPPQSPLDPSRRLASIVTVDELIDSLAYSLEHGTDVDAFERALEAFLRMAEQAATESKRFAPILKRARKLNAGNGLPRELSRLLIAKMTGERLAPLASFKKGRFTAGAFLSCRIDELIAFAEQRTGLSPLAAPTHQRGYIDPAVLVERVAAEQEKSIVSGRQEQVLSLLRLAPISDSRILSRAKELEPNPYVLALRYALGDEVDVGKEARLFVAAARIRHPGKDDLNLIKRYGDCGPDTCSHATYQFRVTVSKGESWTLYRGHVDSNPPLKVSDPDFLASLRHLPYSEGEHPLYTHSHFGGEDEGLILMADSIMPSDTASYFAEGARRLSNNLDWWAAEWHNRAYLSTLLDPTVAFSDMATLCLACGLAGKDPGQTALAVDALLCSWMEGRLQVEALRDTLRRGMTDGLFKAARLYKSLLSASRMHELAPYLVFDLLCGVLCLESENLPKDISSLLDLLVEVKLVTKQALPVLTRQHIAEMRVSGKGKAAQKTLMSD